MRSRVTEAVGVVKKSLSNLSFPKPPRTAFNCRQLDWEGKRSGHRPCDGFPQVRWLAVGNSAHATGLVTMLSDSIRYLITFVQYRNRDGGGVHAADLLECDQETTFGPW